MNTGQLGRGFASAPDFSLIGVHEPIQLKGFGRAPPTSKRCYSVMEQREQPFICAVACGMHHSVLLTAARTCIYTFGRGHRGQLGRGRGGAAALNTIEICPSPRCVQSVFGNEIKQLVCSPDAHHTLLVFATGRVVAFGENTTGVCASGNTKCVYRPSFCNFGEGIKGEEASDDSASLPEASKLMVKPVQRYGTAESYLFARRIVELQPRNYEGRVEEYRLGHPRIVQASTNATHTAVVDTRGVVYTAGLRPIRIGSSMHTDHFGALGRHVASAKDALLLSQVKKLQEGNEGDDSKGCACSSVICGKGFTAFLTKQDWNDINASVEEEDASAVAGGYSHVALHGSIIRDGDVLVSTGLRRPFPVVSPDDAQCAIRLGVGPARRITDGFAMGSGLMLVVDSVE